MVVLLDREPAYGNLWHGSMEAMAVSMTLDILRVAINPQTNRPYLDGPSVDSTTDVQFVVIDDHPLNGTTAEWYRRMSSRPLIHINDIGQSKDLDLLACAQDVVLPLPGGAVPLWGADWSDHDCTSSDLVDVWRRRVLTQFGHDLNRDDPIPALSHNAPRTPALNITLIERVNTTRVILNLDILLEHLRARFPMHNYNVLNLGTLPLAEQIRSIYESTDILVGAHGAGLTHGIWLKRDRALVEILPRHFDHRGFRGLAKLRGLRYFKMQGERINADARNDDDAMRTLKGWPGADAMPLDADSLERYTSHDSTEGVLQVDMVADLNLFMEIMSAAIYGQYQTGTGSGLVE